MKLRLKKRVRDHHYCLSGADRHCYVVSLFLLVLIPSSPLQTDGPSLQHLNKNRPRPVRHHRRKPAALKQQANDLPDSVWNMPTDEPDTKKESVVKTPEPVKPKTPEPVKPKTPELIRPKTPEPVKPKTPEPLKTPEPVITEPPK